MKSIAKKTSLLALLFFFLGTCVFAQEAAIKEAETSVPDAAQEYKKPLDADGKDKVTKQTFTGYLVSYKAGKNLKIKLSDGSKKEFKLASSLKVYNPDGVQISASNLSASGKKSVKITILTKNSVSLVTEIQMLSPYSNSSSGGKSDSGKSEVGRGQSSRGEGRKHDSVKTRTITGTLSSYSLTTKKVTIYDADKTRFSYQLSSSAAIYDARGNTISLNQLKASSIVQAYLVSRNGEIRITKLRLLSDGIRYSSDECHGWNNWDEWDDYDDWDDYDNYYDGHDESWKKSDDSFWTWTWGWNWTWDYDDDYDWDDDDYDFDGPGDWHDRDDWHDWEDDDWHGRDDWYDHDDWDDDWKDMSYSKSTTVSAEGKIYSVNASGKKIVITRDDGKSKQFTLSSKVKVYAANGSSISLSRLKADDKISYVITKTETYSSESEEITEIRLKAEKVTSDDGWTNWGNKGSGYRDDRNSGSKTRLTNYNKESGKLRALNTKTDSLTMELFSKKNVTYTLADSVRVFDTKGNEIALKELKMGLAAEVHFVREDGKDVVYEIQLLSKKN